MDLGLVTFADLHPGLSPMQRMRDFLEDATLADELGPKVFAVGEHHRPDHIGLGAVSHAAVMRAIELFGTQVASIVESETRLAAEVP